MKRALPIAWFVLAAASALLALVSATPFHDTPLGYKLALLRMAVPGTLTAIAVGLAYLLLLRVRPSGPAAIFGLAHLILATISVMLQFISRMVARMVASGPPDETSVYFAMALIYNVAPVAGALGWISFIIVLIIAINTPPPPEEPQNVF